MENLPKTYDETKKLIETLQAHAEKLRKYERNALLKDLKDKISKYGLTAAQLDLATDSSVLVKKPSGKKEKVVMYRNINNHKQTWSGSSRGVKPKWVKDAIRDGNLEQYREKPDQDAL